MNYTNEYLISEAKKAREHAYTPYSNFRVGAALVTKEGKIYHGCNIENASFGATICAERSAIAAAIAGGSRDFSAIAIIGGAENADTAPCTPCGICRQVLSEFCDPDFPVILENGDGTEKIVKLSELLPHSFHLSK